MRGYVTISILHVDNAIVEDQFMVIARSNFCFREEYSLPTIILYLKWLNIWMDTPVGHRVFISLSSIFVLCRMYSSSAGFYFWLRKPFEKVRKTFRQYIPFLQE